MGIPYILFYHQQDNSTLKTFFFLFHSVLNLILAWRSPFRFFYTQKKKADKLISSIFVFFLWWFFSIDGKLTYKVQKNNAHKLGVYS